MTEQTEDMIFHVKTVSLKHMGQRLYKNVLTQRGIDKLKLNNLQNIHVHTHTRSDVILKYVLNSLAL